MRARHVVQLFLALDGNFKLKKKKKNDDPDDVALMDGLAYFPNEMLFQEYIAKAGDSKEVCCQVKLCFVMMLRVLSLLRNVPVHI